MALLSRIRLAAFVDALRQHGKIVAPRAVLDPQAPGEAHALALLDAGRFAVEMGTDKGQALIAGIEEILVPRDDADRAALDSWNARRDASFGRPESWANDPSTLVEEGADDPVWSTEAERCLSCGACVLLCPTCTCFDMVESVSVPCSTGTRERCRDGCMIPGFSAVAHGADFRSDPSERLRHRTRRKFIYQPERYGGGSFCVGCGRCHAHCPVDIGPVGILKALETDGGFAR